MGYLQQRGEEPGKRVDVCLCTILRSCAVYGSKNPLEEKRASIGKSDTDERQEEIPDHVARVGSPELPNDGGVTGVVG